MFTRCSAATVWNMPTDAREHGPAEWECQQPIPFSRRRNRRRSRSSCSEKKQETVLTYLATIVIIVRTDQLIYCALTYLFSYSMISDRNFLSRNRIADFTHRKKLYRNARRIIKRNINLRNTSRIRSVHVFHINVFQNCIKFAVT